MKSLLAIVLLWPLVSLAAANDVPAPVTAAVQFNQWYIAQIARGKAPLTDYAGLSRYVTADTLQKLKAQAALDPNVYDVPDVDMFIKAQSVGDDWQQIAAVASDVDAACNNVYIAFGKKQDHIVIDCMVKEGNAWKVQSVANVAFSRNLPRQEP
ncbi:DUF3828 domain-containing protein [Cronobacter muytjensii]|uniref:DUF3828 domain-containing protein n=1 Tax=Cronobacter muytjensii TaxID=413501 RepID=A0A2T7AV03_9ENTR|nr:DUF3828 domain-containing protein [Cronobacter muytjensii]EGT4339317.1 DUF3828 domain-containing protein [Cronobacter muytjensii]KAB0877711.1 DUF3828 domain-containing protein [Cronobacter muytjensii]MBF4813424.1 DUF3828 domain-containing protein [Cronobacter muytjensii]PUX15665.1 DUF3828 domain-containing protein [Cronobacter muytjensii]